MNLEEEKIVAKMLLGKRTRPPMKRTTSMTEFTLDLNLNHDPNSAVNYQPFDPHNPFTPISSSNTQLLDQQQRILTTAKTIPTTRNRRKSADFVETANFLKACFLCKRRLIPGRDIYMYRYYYIHTYNFLFQTLSQDLKLLYSIF